MTDRRPDRSGDPRDGVPQRSSRLLATAFARLRRDPVLFVPFAVAGLLLAAIDRLRLRDPIPTLEHEGFGTNGISVTLEFDVYPTGVPGTALPYESLVALELPYLVWGIGLQVLSLAAVAVAGAVTMARAMDRAVDLRGVGSLFAFVVAIDLVYRLLASIDALQEMGLFGLVPFAVFLYVLVQLFPLPGLLVAGWGPAPALRESRRRVVGRGWSIFGLVLAIGLSAWLLASLPYGTVTSSALVAPVHAVAIVAVLGRVRTD